MNYKSIFDTKPNKNNKKAFCIRIVKLLNSICYCSSCCVYNDGEKMLDDMFRYNGLNNGYASINDLLKETNPSYKNIFDLMECSYIDEMAIFANIDIIANCIYSFVPNDDRYYYDNKNANEVIRVIFRAMQQYLLGWGYKLLLLKEKKQFFIVENEVDIDITDIKDNKIKNEVINYYDYKNMNDVDEKRKIILVIINDLEGKKSVIKEKLGKNIVGAYGNYANNFNLRHNNVTEIDEINYKKTIAELNNDDMLRWYDYIFSFMLNIYMNLEKVKSVNINNDYI